MSWVPVRCALCTYNMMTLCSCKDWIRQSLCTGSMTEQCYKSNTLQAGNKWKGSSENVLIIGGFTRVNIWLTKVPGTQWIFIKWINLLSTWTSGENQ